jgi:hypothetical protein
MNAAEKSHNMINCGLGKLYLNDCLNRFFDNI